MISTKTVRSLIVAACAALVLAVSSFGGTTPISYKISIDPADPAGCDVEIRIPDQKGTLRLAMAAHPEYDDRYFRYVEDFAAVTDGRPLAITKPDQAVWEMADARGEVTVRYRVRFEPREREWRQTWKPFLTATGGLVGDLHMLMYMVGGEKRLTSITLDMPVGWKAVSGLEPTADPRTFIGTSELLLDSPVMVGDVKEWKFTVAGVPHTVAIFSPTDAKPIDPAPVVDGIRRLAEQSVMAFGKPPYPRYSFLIENGGQAALEHATSVNIGISAEDSGSFDEIAHEYVHVWNLMDVRPRERIGLKYRFADPTGVLWWSEGATIMFGDLLIRRAGIGPQRPTRIKRLESIIARYLSGPGYSTLSADAVSRGDSHPEMLTGDWAGTHLQGEVLTTMLDLMVRNSTDSRKKLDDVMSSLAVRFDSDHGIVNTDIERALVDLCECDMSEFFASHIHGARKLDFDRYLGLIGMRAEVKWETARDDNGNPAVDLRIGPVEPEGELRLRVTNSKSTWAAAGLRTGDRLVMAGGRATNTWPAFRSWLSGLRVGGKATVVVERAGNLLTIEVSIVPFDTPKVTLIELEKATAKQVRLRNAWVAGN